MRATQAAAIGSVAELFDQYRRATPSSAALHQRLVKVLPAGETRAVTYFPPYPVAIELGRGPTITDIDGNRYLDVLNNYTSLIHGHAYPPIVEAVEAALAGGSAHPAPGRRQLELADLLVERYPAVVLLRFTNSGTEAAMLAMRIARRATGRQRIVMFDGGYHGTAAEFADPNSDCVRVAYNDIQALTAAIDDGVAAVFAEPFLGSGGVIPAEDGFLAAAQRVAQRNGALFVLDEVQSLRNAFHGMHGELGLDPDLVLMGKIIGGGLPVGAVGGAADLLRLTAADRADGIRHSGTFNGNPLTMAAGVASLRALTATVITELIERASRLQAAIEAAARAAGVPMVVTRAGSILHVHLVPAPAPVAETMARMERAGSVGAQDAASLHLTLLLHGVYSAPRGMLNLSTVLSDADLQAVADAYGRAFEDVARIVRHERVAPA